MQVDRRLPRRQRRLALGDEHRLAGARRAGEGRRACRAATRRYRPGLLVVAGGRRAASTRWSPPEHRRHRATTSASAVQRPRCWAPIADDTGVPLAARTCRRRRTLVDALVTPPPRASVADRGQRIASVTGRARAVDRAGTAGGGHRHRARRTRAPGRGASTQRLAASSGPIRPRRPIDARGGGDRAGAGRRSSAICSSLAQAKATLTDDVGALPAPAARAEAAARPPPASSRRAAPRRSPTAEPRRPDVSASARRRRSPTSSPWSGAPGGSPVDAYIDQAHPRRSGRWPSPTPPTCRRLRRRDDLRGLLDGYRAMAASRGTLARAPVASAAYDAAACARPRAPCDLDAAAAPGGGRNGTWCEASQRRPAGGREDRRRERHGPQEVPTVTHEERTAMRCTQPGAPARSRTATATSAAATALRRRRSRASAAAARRRRRPGRTRSSATGTTHVELAASGRRALGLGPRHSASARSATPRRCVAPRQPHRRRDHLGAVHPGHQSARCDHDRCPRSPRTSGSAPSAATRSAAAATAEAEAAPRASARSAAPSSPSPQAAARRPGRRPVRGGRLPRPRRPRLDLPRPRQERAPTGASCSRVCSTPATPTRYAAAIAEQRFLAQVQHPLIVEIYNFVTHDGAGYIVMEYVGGTSLKQILKDAPAGATAARSTRCRSTRRWPTCIEILPAFQYLHDAWGCSTATSSPTT